ncbi:hypothetical protein [Tenacibaculum sp.]|uniref:hypothetical protein n=1 Tax=Tenacibaculum sp. TaxID=1906242 RepID=UPI003D142A20
MKKSLPLKKNFKLLAIRSLEDCDERHLKNLNRGEIYKLYQYLDFVFDNDEKEIIEIKYKSDVPENFYADNISISAIVGKNGSGKSTIVELYSAFVFCISKELGLIEIKDFINNHKLSKDEQNRLRNELESLKSFTCGIYYTYDEEIFYLEKNKNGFRHLSYKIIEQDKEWKGVFKYKLESEVKLNERSNKKEKTSDFFSFSFFYSIIVNYSLYGLNTNEIGIWLQSIFHKNDGYQTPIVLNPMRTEGRIDINRLTDLSKSRLLGSVFRELEENQKEEDSLRNLINNKIVEKLILELDLRKFKIIEGDELKSEYIAGNTVEINNDISIYLEYTELNKSRNKFNYLHLLIKAFYNGFDFKDVQFSNTKIKKITVEYILRKVENIVKRYPQFKTYKNRVFRSNAKEEIIKDCFSELAKDYTHSTFKLRQALNFLVYNLYELEEEVKKEYYISYTSKKVNDHRNNLLKSELESNDKYKGDPSENDLELNNNYTYKKYSLINYLPPAFFKVDFEFKDKGFFKDLSSGEKQMIYSVNSIIYHLINLESIYSRDESFGVFYNKHNIILDEVELCFHPDFQRVYVNELVKSIKFLKNYNHEYNIIFLTHSPFILSDIPSSNILRLEEGNPQTDTVSNKTFGANIYSLLNDTFFMKNTIGAFSEEKMTWALSQIKERNVSHKKEIKQIINLIGEPMIKQQLETLFEKVFEINEVEELKNQIKILQNKLKERDDSNKDK